MKSDKIFDALSNIDDDLLAVALGEQEKKNKGNYVLKATVAAAAVIAVIFALVLAITPFIKDDTPGSDPSQDILMNGPDDTATNTPSVSPTEPPLSIISDSTTRVYMKINPYICFDLNNDGQVTNIMAFNEEGEELVSGYEFYGKPLENAAEDLIGQAEKMGYLTEDGQVTFSIDSPSASTAEEYNQLLNEVASKHQKPFKISIRCLLALKEIKSLCAEHFGVSPEIVSFKELECHADHDVARYQIEFKYNDRIYACKVNAVSGEVYDVEIFEPSAVDSTESPDENGCDDTSNSKPGVPATTPTPASKPAATNKPAATKKPSATATPSTGNTQTASITEEKALQIALSDAGVTDYDFEKIKLDGHTCEKHTAKYKVEFISGTIEYKYEIDAVTGEIIKSEMKDNSAAATKPGKPKK